MTNVVIKKNQLDFLMKNIKNDNLINILNTTLNNNAIYKNKYRTDKYNLNLSNTEKNELLNELTYLMTLDFEKSGELNKEGVYIDDIIDIFVKD